MIGEKMSCIKGCMVISNLVISLGPRVHISGGDTTKAYVILLKLKYLEGDSPALITCLIMVAVSSDFCQTTGGNVKMILIPIGEIYAQVAKSATSDSAPIDKFYFTPIDMLCY